MSTKIPLNEFAKNRRLELGIKSYYAMAKLTGLKQETIKGIEERTEPYGKTFRLTFTKIGDALQVDPEEFYRASATWTVDLETINAAPIEIEPNTEIGDDKKDGEIPVKLLLRDFIIGRMMQLGFLNKAALALAGGKKNDQVALSHLINGRSTHQAVSRPFLIRMARVLKLEYDELVLAAQSGRVSVAKICTELPYEAADTAYEGRNRYFREKPRLPGENKLSLPLLSAMVEIGVNDKLVFNRLSDIEDYIKEPLSKETFISLINDLFPKKG